MAMLPGLDSMLNCHCNLSTSQTQHHGFYITGGQRFYGGSSELGFGTKCSHGSMKSRTVHQVSVSRLEFQGWGFGKFDALPCQQCRLCSPITDRSSINGPGPLHHALLLRVHV